MTDKIIEDMMQSICMFVVEPNIKIVNKHVDVLSIFI